MFNKIIIQQMHSVAGYLKSMNPNFIFNYTGSIDVANISKKIYSINWIAKSMNNTLTNDLYYIGNDGVNETKESYVGDDYYFNNLKPTLNITPYEHFIDPSSTTSNLVVVGKNRMELVSPTGSKLYAFSGNNLTEIKIDAQSYSTPTASYVTQANTGITNHRIGTINGITYLIGYTTTNTIVIMTSTNKVFNVVATCSGWGFNSGLFDILVHNNKIYILATSASSAASASIKMMIWDGTNVTYDAQYYTNLPLVWWVYMFAYGSDIYIVTCTNSATVTTNQLNLLKRASNGTYSLVYSYTPQTASFVCSSFSGVIYNGYAHIVITSTVVPTITEIIKVHPLSGFIFKTSLTVNTDTTVTATCPVQIKDTMYIFVVSNTYVFYYQYLDTTNILESTWTFTTSVNTIHDASFLNAYGNIFFTVSDRTTINKWINVYKHNPDYQSIDPMNQDQITKSLLITHGIRIANSTTSIRMGIFENVPTIVTSSINSTENYTLTSIINFTKFVTTNITAFSIGAFGSLPLTIIPDRLYKGGNVSCYVSGNPNIATLNYVESTLISVNEITTGNFDLVFNKVTVADDSKYMSLKFNIGSYDKLYGYKLTATLE